MFVWSGPGFLAGALVLLSLPRLPGWEWGVFALLLSLILAAKKVWLPAWTVFGFFWTLGYVQLFWHPLASDLEGRDLTVVGTIKAIPVKKTNGWRFDFQVSRKFQKEHLPATIRLSWYGGPTVKMGQTWRLTVRLKRPYGFRNPGGFDYERWLFAHLIGATGYVRHHANNQLLAEGKGVASLRQQLADAMDKTLGNADGRGLIKALALGIRDGISESQWSVLRATGTAHLMAISGLHIGFVAGWLLMFGRHLWLRAGRGFLNADQVGAVMAWSGALGYAAIAGFALPTKRALLMLSAFLLAWLWRRNLSAWQGMSLALLGCCLWDPLAPLGAGFWLSFGAVAWIYYAVWGCVRVPHPLRAGLQIQGILMAGLAPLTVYFFHQVGWSSPLANFIAVPLVGFVIVPTVLIGCGVWGYWPFLAEWLWKIAAGLLTGSWQGLVWLARWSEGSWALPSPSLAAVVLAVIGIGVLVMPRGIPGRWLGGMLLLPFFFPFTPRPSAGGAWLTILDVGQGLAVVVETQKHVLVYDTGPRFSERFDAGSDIILPFLRHHGWRHVDRIVVSHSDRDHSGGLKGLHHGMAAEVLTSSPDTFQDYASRSCRAGDSWVWEGVTFQVLWPKGDWPGPDNDRSCVLRMVTRFGTALLPGDIEEAGEAELVARYGESLQAQVLVAPHHGSATSSTMALLEAVQPRYVLISSGYRNRFGFPSPEVMARYRAMGASVIKTAEQGGIEIRLDSAVRIRGWRQLDRHLWSAR